MIRVRLTPVLFAAATLAGWAGAGQAQEGEPGAGPIRIGPAPVATSSFESARAIERDIEAAILAEDDAEVRDAYIERALESSRRFADRAPGDAEAQYWLAVSLGVKTEYAGAFAKLTTGKECYEVTLRTLELAPDHAGAHELMGRIHAGVMRLPWVVRKLGGTLGMNDALGDASWETAEGHLKRAAELDERAIAPRLELGKLLSERDRAEEGLEWFRRALAIDPSSELDRSMQAEAREVVSPGLL